MKKLISFTMLALALSLSACQKKDDKSVTIAKSIKVQNNGVGYQSALPTGTGYIDGEVGVIYSSQVYAEQFNQAAHGFVSSSMNPSSLGYVDFNEGIRFSGIIAFGSGGKLNFGGSRLKIEIWDEYALDGQETPFTVSFNTMKAGSVAQNGAAQLVFEDAYGAVSLKGKIQGQVFQGTVSYVNKKSTISGQKPISGTLGDFEISTCGFFNCRAY